MQAKSAGNHDLVACRFIALARAVMLLSLIVRALCGMPGLEQACSAGYNIFGVGGRIATRPGNNLNDCFQRRAK
jgi:hypothetical protein